MPSTPSSVIDPLARSYPQCRSLLEALGPLWMARQALARDLPPAAPPAPDAHSLSQGKPWLSPDERLALYVDAPFMAAAPEALLDAALQGLPGMTDALEKMRGLLRQDREAFRSLTEKGLLGKDATYWARKHGQNRSVAEALRAHLAGTAAARVAHAAGDAAELAGWSKGYCPVCGGQPHGGCLRGKEGQRFLQCGLCGHMWRFSRTTCPFCEDPRPEGREVIYLENSPNVRAETCRNCRSYLLMPDFRENAEEPPLELFLLCLMPLDMHLRERGYVPGAALGRSKPCRAACR